MEQWLLETLVFLIVIFYEFHTFHIQPLFLMLKCKNFVSKSDQIGFKLHQL